MADSIKGVFTTHDLGRLPGEIEQEAKAKEQAAPKRGPGRPRKVKSNMPLNPRDNNQILSPAAAAHLKRTGKLP